MTFLLIEPDLGRISGGLRFNAELVAAAWGRIERIVAPGSWPEPSEEDMMDLRRLVAQCQSADDVSGASPRPVLIDGLIGCSLSSPLSGPVVMLQHSLAQASPAQHSEALAHEAQSLRAASAVVTPSASAAAEVWRRYGVTAEVAHPGTRGPRTTNAAPSMGGPASDGAGWSKRAHLICVGAMEDNKNQLFLAHVLQNVRRRGVTGWRATFAGPMTDIDYGQKVRAALTDLIVSGRPESAAGQVPGEPFVECVGELDGGAVDDLYRDADLLLLPSKSETFGMVVREAAAAAVPAFVTAGTGAEEALIAGDALPLDVDTWAEILERWMCDDADRAQLAATAFDRRESALHSWDETARIVLAVLDGAS